MIECCKIKYKSYKNYISTYLSYNNLLFIHLFYYYLFVIFDSEYVCMCYFVKLLY